ncbi:MAG: hypothetical protein ACI825_000742 [Planctomycetota bacterium]|jgi:hypothetical protein|uniref:hypothetical protein n=1 Tax=Patiriisocius sp. Uisw_047 TaxID=3230969 RepID=UPI0039EB91A9
MKFVVFTFLLAITITACGAQNSYKNISEKNGKIGIGTSNPDELLTVKGKVHAQEVIVDLKGAVAPDYVFEAYFDGASTLSPEYKMLTLQELALYIEVNHHLPKVQSAASLKGEGLELKKMNLLLLEKVEELTLYTLEQQSQLEVLKERLTALEKKEE